jgi:hypothetical protein
MIVKQILIFLKQQIQIKNYQELIMEASYQKNRKDILLM